MERKFVEKKKINEKIVEEKRGKMSKKTAETESNEILTINTS